MVEKTEKSETIQEIAIRLVEEQMRTMSTDVGRGPKERTIFLLGSKGVGKSTIINKFLGREEGTRATLALEYSFGRRTSPTQHVNLWELGSLENAAQLIQVPMQMHGVDNFSALITLDLSSTQHIWRDLELAYTGLKETCMKMLAADEPNAQLLHERAKERVKKEHPEMASLDLLPFPVLIVGGKYDIFMDFDPEVKKHICRCLRSVAHLIGGSLLFYTQKVPKLSKTLRDTMSHLAFGSPTNPFRVHAVDYNDALSIWFGTDSWARIGESGAMSLPSIRNQLSLEVPQLELKNAKGGQLNDPAKDNGFRESVIDEMRQQKDEELRTILKESQLRGHFESVPT